MSRISFRARLLEKRPLFFDGAMGTILMQQGYGSELAEKLNIDQPEVIYAIQKAYVDAGVNIIETNTFNASPIKLRDLKLEDKLLAFNTAAVAIAKKAAGSEVYVAGSIGPTGKLMEPIGDLSFDSAYESYKLQAKVLANAGVDLFIVETISDIQEIRAALIAIKDVSDLPVICSMTYNEQGKTLTGTDMYTAAVTLSQLGADVISTNCSIGPDGVLKLYKKYYQELGSVNVPLMVMPNAGMPEVIDGKIVYTMTPETFMETMDQFRAYGVTIYGGCCGTTPAHIAAVANSLKDRTITFHNTINKEVFFTSRTKVVKLSEAKPFLKIAEALNPTARKKFAEELKQGKEQFLREQAKEQTKLGADLLDINVGVPELNMVELMKKSVLTLSNIVDTPLCIDSDDPATIEVGLKNYPGIVMINSVNGKKSSLEKILPLAKKYGANLIGLALDEKGIPETASERVKIAETIFQKAAAIGFDTNKLFIDGLVMAVSADPKAPLVTLAVTDTLTKKGIKTSLGVSNVSFGLPERKNINNVFLDRLAKAGLSASILSVATFKQLDGTSLAEAAAVKVLSGEDINARSYISLFQTAGDFKPVSTKKRAEADLMELISEAVINGEDENIIELIEAELPLTKPEQIIEKALLPALDIVGKYYSEGKYYLPQMIASANTMKKGFSFLKEKMPKDSMKSKGTAVICTVEGDVHDIGKNIVAMMLENHGIKVVDLGKDVPADTIVAAVKKHNADVVLLSALLTTTMLNMKDVKQKLKEHGLAVPVMLGGAVVTSDFAKNLEAHYTSDAASATDVAKRLINKERVKE